MYMCLDSEEAFHAALRSTKFLYVRYGAPWCPQCEALDRALEELQRQFPKVTFAGLDAERLAEVAQRQGVEAVPHAVFYKNGRRFGEVTQIALPAIKSGLRRMIYSEDDPNAPMDQRLTALINRHKVMLFMKGSPQVPRNGFSRQAAEILKEIQVAFDTFDILENEEVRRALKTFSKWKTYPQLYVEGKLIGGLDILKGLHEEGKLAAIVAGTAATPECSIASKVDKRKLTAEDIQNMPPDRRLKALVGKFKVLLFMKGTPERPRNGFSRQAVDMLKESKVHYEAVDVLEQADLCGVLKQQHRIATFPQLFVHGQLLGGVEGLRELKEEGRLTAALAGKAAPAPVKESRGRVPHAICASVGATSHQPYA